VKITPLDIKKQEFAVKFRGYAPEEVHSYLEMAASELEDALKKNLELEQRMAMLEERLASYTRMETILQETLLTTQKAAEETKAMAEKKAQALIAEAQLMAQKIAGEANERLVAIQREIADLKNQKESFSISLRSLLETQLSLLEMAEKRLDARQEVSAPSPIKRKAEMSDAELEQIVDEFERKLADDKNGSRKPNTGFSARKEI
jgi:cell division initiation protein